MLRLSWGGVIYQIITHVACFDPPVTLSLLALLRTTVKSSVLEELRARRRKREEGPINPTAKSAQDPDDVIEAYLEAQLEELRARRDGGNGGGGGGGGGGGSAAAACSKNAKRRRVTEEARTDCFTCSISQEKMLDPVICADGHTYERSQIELWLQTNNTSPKTNLPLQNKTLIPNLALKAAIVAFD